MSTTTNKKWKIVKLEESAGDQRSPVQMWSMRDLKHIYYMTAKLPYQYLKLEEKSLSGIIRYFWLHVYSWIFKRTLFLYPSTPFYAKIFYAFDLFMYLTTESN